MKKSGGRMYELRLHSIRKYFRTRVLASGVQSCLGGRLVDISLVSRRFL